MIKNFTLMAAVLTVYLMPLGSSLTWQAELSVRSALSLCLVLFALTLSRKPCALIVAGCEIIALLYNVIMAIGYSLDVVIVDRYYEVMMTALLTTEISALMLGLLSNELRRLQQYRKCSGHNSCSSPRTGNMG